MEGQGLHEELEEPRPELGAEAPSVGGGCGCGEEVEDGDDLVEHLHGVPREKRGHVAVATAAVVRGGGAPGFQIQ